MSGFVGHTKIDPLQRLYMKTVRTPGCWPWIGARKPTGYGNFLLKGRFIGAHVASFILHGGTIPEGKQIDHTCGHPSCVNPEHLRVVTPSENILASRRHWNRSKTHCIHGHEFTPENTYYNAKRNARSCRACKLEKQI